MERFRRWAEHEYDARQRLLVLVPQVTLVFVLIPAAIVGLGPAVDRWLGLPSPDLGGTTAPLGAVLAAVGATWSVWAVYSQYTRGRGTPAPVVPTRELVVEGPYRYSRNPMIAGGTLFFLGVALWAGTATGVGFAALFLGVQVAYIKAVEERELAERFGSAYREYRRETPFLVPRPRRREE